MLTLKKTAVTSLIGLLIFLAAPIHLRADDAPTNPAQSEWPRVFEKDENQVTLYQPQVDEWKDYSTIRYRQALALTLKGKTDPVFGVLAVSAKTVVDEDTRTVLLTDLDVDVRFPDADPNEVADYEKMARDVLPKKTFLTVSLDHVLAYLDDGPVQASPVDVNLDPPTIYHSESPAILVIFLGPPQFKPIEGTRLMFAANTNWDVLMDQDSSQYYLLNGESWRTTSDVLKGPWKAATTLPPDFSKLPADENWDDVRKQIPPKPPVEIPKVVVSTEPAELIVTDGKPAYSPISGTKLMYVSNPEMPLFLNTADNSFYYLVAGRWFRAKSLDGPWSAASGDLPADFANIPDGSPMQDVRASVPGTADAKDAVLLASVPTTAEVNINDTTLDVEYDGDPKFVPIEDTAMTYAANTQYSVIYAERKYYCCYGGVWFVSGVSRGPWVVCAAVPKVIYTIPPRCPLYNVTYVRVYSSTPTTVVVGYTSGYRGAYVARTGTVVFGAGLAVGAIIANNSNWYHCRAAYFSYGCGASYRYGYKGFYRRATLYGPYGGAGRYAAYNPKTGSFTRGAYRYGPAGSASAREAYNPYTDTYRARAGASNGYRSWDRGVVARGNDWAQGGRTSGPRGTAGWVESSNGKAAAGVAGRNGGAVIKGNNGDVYAGKDGNVYRRQDGQWQQKQKSGWQNLDKNNSNWAKQQPAMTRDAQSRARGNSLQSRAGQAQQLPSNNAGSGRTRSR